MKKFQATETPRRQNTRSLQNTKEEVEKVWEAKATVVI